MPSSISFGSLVNLFFRILYGVIGFVLILSVIGGVHPQAARAQGNAVSQQPANEDQESGDEIMKREAFFHLRRAGGPGKSIPPGGYEAARQQTVVLNKQKNALSVMTSGSSWVNVNPTGLFYNVTRANYISGRTNSFAFHPTIQTTFFIAAAGGGVWKTTDGGAHFSPMTDNISALTSGAVAVDPTNGNVVYVATGELNYSLDSYFGDGIFKSTDGGTTWTKIATTSIGSYFSSLVINPQNSSIIYAAGSAGVYKTTNAGASWSSTNSNSYANSLVMDPTNPQTLYVTTGFYNANIIRKTTDGGASWTTLTNGLPASHAARTTLAISASNPSIVYASIANDTSYALLGLYRTTDGGATWVLQNSSTNYLGGQGWYDNSITVNPTNSSLVVAGGLDVYTSTNGGASFTQRSLWSTTNASRFTHADIHYLGYDGTNLYCGSDGGVYLSTNDGSSWSDMNQTVSTLQFQSADYDPTNTLKMYGGTQDNDKEYTTNGGTLWYQNTTGDGGYTVVDPVNTNYVYGQYVEGSIMRSTNSGSSFTEFSPTASSGGLFYNPYRMAPGDHNTIVFGRGDVWKTTTAQTATSNTGWTQIASTTTVGGGSVSAIGISATSTSKIYIGTDDGRILVTTDNGGTWSTSTGFPYVSDFAVDDANDSVCYATCTGFSATQHVFKTTNSGATWSSITGNLPNIPVNTVVVRFATPRTIFAGTDLGVYESTNEGSSWVAFNSGLPAVEIYDLKYRESNQLLLAATHGRGCFTFDLSGLAIQRTLTINSSNPSSGIPVAVSPNDINSAGNGITPFTRLYNDQTTVTLTAPATQSTNYFSKWLKDSVNLSANTVISVVADTNHTLTAVYALTPTFTLTVASSNPSSGVSVSVSQADNLAQQNGTTPMNRYYYSGVVITLTAPHGAGGNYFLKWTKDGVDYSTDTATTITMDSAHTLTAMYGVTPVFQKGTDSLYLGRVKANHSTLDSLTISNTGNASLSVTSVTAAPSFFTVTPSSGTIPVAGNMKFYVTFTAPADNARHNGSLIFSHNAPTSPDTVKLAGDSYNIFIAQPDTLPFGDVFTGTSEAESLAVSVGTTDTMTISSITSDNPRFGVVPGSGTVMPTKPLTVHVTFQPNAAGVQTGHLVFTHNKLGSPDTTYLLGNGVASGFSVLPSTLPFGPVSIHTTATESLRISDPGTGQLNISSIVSDDSAEFTIAPGAPVSVSPAQYREFYVSFRPLTLGPKSAHLIFYHNAASSPDSVAVTGSGVQAAFSLSKSGIVFGPAVINTMKVDSIVVSDTGLGMLVIDTIYSTDQLDFGVSPNKAVSISPGGSRTIYCGFTPASESLKTADLVFVDNAPGSPDSLQVSGSGIQGEVVISFASEWNMVSVPLNMAGAPVKSLFPTAISSAFVYAGSYTVKDTLSGGVGCWIRFPAGVTDTLTGIPLVTDTISVSQGWNLIGSTYQVVPVAAVASIPAGMTTSNYFGYNGGYINVDTLQPGRGYWVKSSSAGSLVLTSGFQLPGKAAPARTHIVSTPDRPPSPPDAFLADKGVIPKVYSLKQAYPDPFNPSTTIVFDLEKASLVTLKVYNMLGEAVATLRQNEGLDAGRYENIFSASNLSSGIYYYSIIARSADGAIFRDVKKMVLLK